MAGKYGPDELRQLAEWYDGMVKDYEVGAEACFGVASWRYGAQRTLYRMWARERECEAMRVSQHADRLRRGADHVASGRVQWSSRRREAIGR